MKEHIVEQSGLARAVKFAGSVSAFSKAVGVTHQSVYQWLQRGWLTPKRAEQVSELYGVPAAELLDPEITKLVRVTDVADVAQDLL
jgi:DNA-binding transcriptional regulator YdaS (Cro superfamily)